jgi:hypothetical protein
MNFPKHTTTKGVTVNAAHDPKSASNRKVGIVATLRARLRADGRSAPTSRRVPLAPLLLIAATLTVAALFFGASSAVAAENYVHKFTTSFGEACTASPCPGGQFSGNAAIVVNQASGDVYVADSGDGRIEKFSADGAFLSSFGTGELTTPTFLAVDNSPGGAGDVYVGDTATNVVSKFDSSGAPIASWGTAGQLTGTVSEPFGPLDGIAVDNTGVLYVATGGEENFLTKFSQGGAELGETHQLPFEAAPIGIAVDSTGAIYKARASFIIAKLDPTDAVLNEFFDNGTNEAVGPATGLVVDPPNDDVYVAHATEVTAHNAAGETLQVFGSPHITAAAGIAVDGATRRIYISDPGASAVEIFDPVPVPDVTTGEATALAATSATLNGEVNPSALPIEECFFEYVAAAAFEPEAANPYQAGSSAQCEAPDAVGVGSGTEPIKVHADVTGLAPSTVYQFRLLARNENGTAKGADQIFGEPLHIDATSVASITSSAAELQAQIDPGGVAATYHFEYSTDPGFAAAASVPIPDAAIASARADQAVFQAISGLTPETTYFYRVVAANSAAPAGIVGPTRALITHSTSLDTALPDGRAYELVSPSVKSTGGGVFAYFEGSGSYQRRPNNPFMVAEDGAAITYPGVDFFESSGPPTGMADQYTSFRGPEGWTTRNTSGEEPEEAFAPLPAPAVPPAPVLPSSATPAAQVQEETPDGSLVFFTDSGKLTPDSTAAAGEPDLYRYDVEAEQITDLTVDLNSGRHADVQGVLGVGGEGAAAGSYVYFVANGVLGDAVAEGAQPGDCQREAAEPPTDSCNLYLIHEGVTTFIAALSARDEEFGNFFTGIYTLEVHDWAPGAPRTAEASPNGRYLAFAAHDELTGQPTAGTQVFRYDAAAKSLLCASCNPDGSTSPAAGNLGAQPGGGQRQHYIANDGRLFFNDSGALSPRDLNGGSDVYEFEDAGTGTCATPGGCRSLISGGGGDNGTTGLSYLVAVSAEGNDVFFTSNQRLSSEDRDASLDMYDARVDGREPPLEAPICTTAEGCHGPVPPPPVAQTAGSTTFHGPGNRVEKPCKKSIVKKGTKCVKKPSKHHKRKKHHKKSSKGKSKHPRSHSRAGHKHGAQK